MTDFLSLDNTSSRQFIISQGDRVPSDPQVHIKRPKVKVEDKKVSIPVATPIIESVKDVTTTTVTPHTPVVVDTTPKDPLVLHVGKAFNAVEQTVVSEGGLHKVAPVALSVNGAVILHDIGYSSNKKDLVPLYLDPYTNRVTTYRHK